MTDPEKKERQQAAAEALMNWSKWLVTLQPAGILTGAGIVGLSSTVSLSPSAKILLILSLACAVTSIIAATFALGGLPGVIERLPSTADDEKGIYDMRVYWGGRIRVWQTIFVEHLFFVFGIIFFSAFLCISIALHKPSNNSPEPNHSGCNSDALRHKTSMSRNTWKKALVGSLLIPPAKIFEFADGGVFECKNAGRQEARKSFAASDSGPVKNLSGRISGVKRVSEYVEESPILLARPSRPESWDVLRGAGCLPKG